MPTGRAHGNYCNISMTHIARGDLPSEQGEREGEATIICGGPCGVSHPPMPPRPVLAPAKPDARLALPVESEDRALPVRARGLGALEHPPKAERTGPQIKCRRREPL